MYPPPSHIVIRQFKEGVIESVSYGKYTIHLVCDNGNCLSFEAPFRFGPGNDLANRPIHEFPLSESDLMRVVGCAIVDVECDEDGTIIVRFANDDVLVVYANDPAYEAYTLLVGGQEYVV